MSRCHVQFSLYILILFNAKKEQITSSFDARSFSSFKMLQFPSESTFLESSCKLLHRILVYKEHGKGKDDNNIFPKTLLFCCSLG